MIVKTDNLHLFSSAVVKDDIKGLIKDNLKLEKLHGIAEESRYITIPTLKRN